MRTDVATACLLMAAAGCAEMEHRLDCMEAEIAVRQAIHGDWSDPNACTAHADCVRTSDQVHCPDEGASFSGCGVVIHADSVEGFASHIESVKEDLCPRIQPGCFSSAICLTTLPRCVEGACVGLRPEQIDAGPPDSGTVDGG